MSQNCPASLCFPDTEDWLMPAVAKKRSRRLNKKYLCYGVPQGISSNWLRGVGACWPQREIFNREWPNGCAANVATVKRAVELGLKLNWLFARLIRTDNNTQVAQDYRKIRDKFSSEMRADGGERYTAEECRHRRNKRVAKLLIQALGLK